MAADINELRLGLAPCTVKKKGLPSPRAEAGQGNIETVHEPKPIQTAGSPWGQGRRAMRGPHGPQTHVYEGACAIKVSMRCYHVASSLIYDWRLRTDHVYFRAGGR